jgi:hypothetical protein
MVDILIYRGVWSVAEYYLGKYSSDSDSVEDSIILGTSLNNATMLSY